MAGTRVDERRLGELSGVPVAPLLQPGSGSAFWYLALKNWVVASGIKPRMVFIFFRDTNLTDVMFRLDQQFRWSLDLVALEREDELNAVVATRLGPLRRVRNVRRRAARRRAGAPAGRACADGLAGTVIDRVRRRQARVPAADERAARPRSPAPDGGGRRRGRRGPELDFARDVDASVLPLMLRDASRRPDAVFRPRAAAADGAPSAGAVASVAALRRRPAHYVTARGAIFHDDTGDPALTLDMYEDGDHLARRARRRFYTENLYNRLRPHFQ